VAGLGTERCGHTPNGRLPETVTPLRDNTDMKFVMFADLHLERPFAWAEPSAALRRREAIRDTLENIVTLAVDERADAILCGGDLYEDARFSPDLTQFVASTVDCGIPFLVSPGNHDHLGPASLYARARFPSTVHVFAKPNLRAFELAEGMRVWGAAHVAPSGTPGFFDQLRGPLAGANDGINLGLFHGSERAGFAFEAADKHPHAPFDVGQIRSAGLDFAFVGHHHKATTSASHCYPGNPDPLEFGEDGAPRGAVLATVDEDGTVDVEARSVQTTTTHTISVDVTGSAHGTEVLARLREAVRPLSGFVRADLIGEIDPDVELELPLLHDVGRDLDGFIVRLGGVHRSYRLDEIAAEEASVRAHFVRMVQADTDLDPEDARLMLELGLRAFDNRRDLEVV